ncbi:aromatic ring-hydroxylating dioxygenase subunit alpha [Hazenella sp. IB182353]|uniref:aromatic ring-hydroxylating oxygenase subunit alpha n=1 Tax=Polycladospora coralii TaxID=2771432 RepID=UPI0017473A29|nr:aromatic ring-hydroxylating dioxygenase subunit alpha [Polycladospora coralii]MBS7529387.1 aromatic ring-hydroxylating dioxygenase subunit alpha [Polycladospora coralii]
MQTAYRLAKEKDERTFPCQWYAVKWSKSLKKRPLKISVVGLDIVLFRDQKGVAKAVHAYCPHRGADLVLGTCSDGHIRCPYHAWEFDGEGTCKQIPAHPKRPIPDFAHTNAYPVQEKAGLIWVYPAVVTDPPSLELFPELDDPDLVLSPYDAVWSAHLTRAVESVLDVAHLPIVHQKTIGRRLAKEIEINFESEGDQIEIHNGDGILEFRFPHLWILRPKKQRKAKFINFVTFTPVEKEKTLIFGHAGRNFAKFPGVNFIFSYYSSKILKEDQAVVESQHPRPIPEALRLEAHVPADGPQVRFRQRWYAFLTNKEPRIVISDTKKA